MSKTTCLNPKYDFYSLLANVKLNHRICPVIQIQAKVGLFFPACATPFHQVS